MIDMGGGSWSADTYKAATGARVSSGSTFGYTSATRSAGRGAWKAHESLDPKIVAGDTSRFAGATVRESRDNAEHPNSTPISVIFDATGSMGSVPRVVQEKLAGLFNLLVRKNYVEDPQIMIGAYGDSYCDAVPLQISQFESDNRIDENLDNLFLEGGGGGNNGETATLAWYYLANHTSTDSFEKRGKKGYAFFVADEVALDLKDEHIKDHIGDGQPLSELTAKALAKAVQEKWEVFILLIDNGASKMQGSEKFYTNLFGRQNVLVIEDPASIAETIALALGASEGTLDLDDAKADLKEIGTGDTAAKSAIKAVALLRGAASGAVAKAAPDMDLDGKGATRL
jgi:hypothetical protein